MRWLSVSEEEMKAVQMSAHSVSVNIYILTELTVVSTSMNR